MNFLYWLMIVFSLRPRIVTGMLYRDDECPLKNGGSGICKLLSDCPAAIEDLEKGVFPQQCGFEGIQSIVCCLQPKSPTTTSTRAKPKPNAPLVMTQNTIAPPKMRLPALPPGKSRLPGEMSDYKCREYLSYGCEEVLNPSLVVGGVPAYRREFPHMVQFGYEGSDGLKWTCGGSLLSDEYVLTAAHCLSDRSLGNAKYARMGIRDLDDYDEHKQQYKVLELIPHPDYKAPSNYNDIGLVKLDGRVELNPWVHPACIYTKNATLLRKVIASGWGKTDYAGKESTVLRKVDLELYDQPACNKTYRQQSGSLKLKDGIKDDIMICAGHSKELRDTCQGDSGGPLQVFQNGATSLICMYDLVGITSFGIACGIAVNVPAVYTRVSYYTKWIEDIVWPLT